MVTTQQVEEARQILVEYAEIRLKEIDNMDYLVRQHYSTQRKSMKKLIEILKFSI